MPTSPPGCCEPAPKTFTPPTGSIVSPPAGMTVSGLVQIIVSANDNRAMGEVALSINGEYIATIENAPYAYIWDTTTEAEDSEHIISVVLVDLSGIQQQWI